MASARKGPRNSSERELLKVGVTVIDSNAFWLECNECHGKWSPPFPGMSRRWYRGYWKCPHFGCNAE